MDYLETFKSRFENFYKKSREVTKTRECIVENLLTTRRTTRAQFLTERRNITKEALSPCPSPVLMVSAKEERKSPSKKMDRLARMKLWKAEKLKKMEEQKAKSKPVFKVSGKANVGFPNLNENKSLVKKSFAPSNHIFKAPVNVKAIEMIAVKKTMDVFKRVTRSQKTIVSSSLSLPVRSRKKQTVDLKKNEKNDNKTRGKLTRQNVFDSIIQETNNKAHEQKTKTPTTENKVKKGNVQNKENIYSNVKNGHKITEDRSTRRSFGLNIENNEQLNLPEKNTFNEEISKVATSSKRKSIQKSISGAEDKTNKKQTRRKSFRKSTTNADKEIELNGAYEFINQDNTTPVKDDVISLVAAYTKCKRRSLRLNVEDTDKQKLPESHTLNEEISKKRTSSKRKSMHKSHSEVEDSTNKVTSNKRQSIRKSNKRSTSSTDKESDSNKRQSIRKSNRKSTSSTDKENDLNSTYELINPEDQKTPVKDDDVFSPVAAYISPFVTTSRGKGSIKKENKERNIRGLPSFTEFEAPGEEANTSFQITGASYFHTSLNNEISRLNLLCNTWNTYKENTLNLTEDAKDLIDVAVGQANLLMNKKFQQFRKLIVSCENGYGEEKPVTCEDLQGFWDMIYIQVENLNTRFNRLTELKNQNWQEIIPVVQQKIMKKGGNKKRAKSAATSSLRAAIEAARQKTKSASSMEDNVFNGGFFVVKSPQKKGQTPEASRTRTPAKDRRSLLKSVLSSETRKSSRKSVGSPGVSMMKASQTAKSVENLNFTLPTPGKSILKKTKNRKSIAHSSKAVLFKDYNSDTE